jgi:hypothetical protein
MARIIADPAAVPVATAPRPSAKRGILRFVWPLVCLVQLGLIGGWLFTRYYLSAGPAPQAADTGRRPDGAKSPDALKPGEVPTVERGDELVREGRYDLAIKPLHDALVVSPGSPAEPAAALTLAAAYVLTGQPQPACRTVREHRDPIGQPPYRATGIFLDAYGQFLSVKTKSSAHEASELLAALWGVEQKEAVLGSVGALLMGHAYRDLDHPDDMIAVYRAALVGAQGPVAAEMSYEVAEDLYQRNRREEARKLFLPLAKGDDRRWAAEAQLRLAEIALAEKRPNETLQTCRRLLEDKQAGKRETVLLLMSKAYEMTGEYRKAAHCLEGKVPE